MKKHPVRTSAKAIIIKNNQLLAIKHKQKSQEYYALPGGGQNHNENLHATLCRECLEELGAEVEVKDILFVRDYIADNHEFADQSPGFHQVEIIFLCHILNPDSLHEKSEPDKHQIGIEWIPVKEIENYPLYPREIRKKIKELNDVKSKTIYLGDVN